MVTIPATMRAVVLDAPGPPDALQVHDVPVPTPHAGEVLIEIDYVVRVTNDRRNLVYPFYVIPREDEP